VARSLVLEVLLEQTPQLLALDVGRILDIDISALGNDICSGIRTLGAVPAGRLFRA